VTDLSLSPASDALSPVGVDGHDSFGALAVQLTSGSALSLAMIFSTALEKNPGDQ